MSGRLRHILKKYTEGKITLEEDIELSEQLADKKNRDTEQLLFKDWKSQLGSEPVSYLNLPAILDRVHHRIRIIEDRKTVKLNWWKTFQRAAAIMIMPLMIAFAAYYIIQTNESGSYNSYAEIQCPLGVRTKFQLPDGTTGFLNSGSTLRYPLVFAKQRNVKLIGEAYFDVVSDKKHPFTVKTPLLTTKVLGTQFNIIAYANENTEEIILQEGEVEVYSESGRKLEVLQPDQNLVLNTETKRYYKSQVEANQYVSWTEGKLIFRNESMQQVAKRLGRWYNVEIEIKDSELISYAFRATFVDESLEEVLKVLARTAPIKYNEQPREISNAGTYEKRKVIISIDKKRLDAF